MDDTRRILLGRVIGAFGVRGEVKLHSFTDPADTVMTTDPGRAIRNGLWNDMNKFKTPNIRGLAARPPFFHNGIANTLLDVVRHYESALGFVYTPQEEADLVAFLTAF